MIRDTIVQVAAILFTVVSLLYITIVIGYILFSWGRTPPPAPKTFEEFWQQLESRGGARYTEEEAESLYTLYQERRGQVISSTDGQKGG